MPAFSARAGGLGPLPSRWALDPTKRFLWAAVGAPRTWSGLLEFCDAVAWAAAYRLAGTAGKPPSPWDELHIRHGAAWAAVIATADKTTKRVGCLSAVRWYARTSKAAARSFPPVGALADDAAGWMAHLVGERSMPLAPASVRSYVGNIVSFAGHFMGEVDDRSLRAWKLVLVRISAWMPKSVDSRPALSRAVFTAALGDRRAPDAVRLALGFCFDTASRAGDFLTEPRARTAAAVPMPLSHMRVGTGLDGAPWVELMTTVKGDRTGEVTRIRASCSPSSPAYHPCGFGTARAIRAWVTRRRERGARDDEPLWRLPGGGPVTAQHVVALLRRHSDKPVSRHTVRISSASIAVATGGMSLSALADLGGWKTPGACKRYVRALGAVDS